MYVSTKKCKYEPLRYFVCIVGYDKPQIISYVHVGVAGEPKFLFILTSIAHLNVLHQYKVPMPWASCPTLISGREEVFHRWICWMGLLNIRPSDLKHKAHLTELPSLASYDVAKERQNEVITVIVLREQA